MFTQLHAERGCCSYLLGCPETGAAMVVDPVLELTDRILGAAAESGLRIRYVAETHTHADHFSSVRQLAARCQAVSVAHRSSPAPYISMHVNDGELLRLGSLRVGVLHTPGHTGDSVCYVLPDRVLTGDTLLIGGCGRTDFPGGSAEQLHHSLFEKLLCLDDATLVFPGHDYRRRGQSTIGAEKAGNPRLAVRDRAEFVTLMGQLDLGMPDHLSEALRTNRSGCRTVEELLRDAAARVPFMAIAELAARGHDDGLVVLDVRERAEYDAGHIPGAVHIPRGQLELRVNGAFPNPTVRIVCYCQFGKISTLAAATLRDLGFQSASALDGGFAEWCEAGRPRNVPPSA